MIIRLMLRMIHVKLLTDNVYIFELKLNAAHRNFRQSKFLLKLKRTTGVYQDPPER